MNIYAAEQRLLCYSNIFIPTGQGQSTHKPAHKRITRTKNLERDASKASLSLFGYISVSVKFPICKERERENNFEVSIHLCVGRVPRRNIAYLRVRAFDSLNGRGCSRNEGSTTTDAEDRPRIMEARRG